MLSFNLSRKVVWHESVNCSPLSFALAATPAFALYNTWNGKAGNSVFNDGRNWGGTPDFSRAACVSGAQSQIGAMKSGTYTLMIDRAIVGKREWRD